MSQPSTNGELTGSVAAGFTYTPASGASFVNQDHDLAYLVVDPDGHVARETIRIRVLAAGDTNRPPVAVAATPRSSDRGTGVLVAPVDNDFDPDGDGFFVASVLDPAHGRVTNHQNNTFTYAPDAGFSGTDTVTYVIRDTHGLLGTGTVTVWVDSGAASGQMPDPAIDYFVAFQGSPLRFAVADLLVNDNEPQGQALSVVEVSQPSTNGELTGSVAAGFTYTPASGASFVNQDHDLAYLLVDPDGHVARETIRIRVLAAGDTNRPPVAVPDTASSSGAGVLVAPVDNDFDPDGDGFFVASVLDPAHGRVTNHQNNTFTYTPDAEVLRHRHRHLRHP